MDADVNQASSVTSASHAAIDADPADEIKESDEQPLLATRSMLAYLLRPSFVIASESMGSTDHMNSDAQPRWIPQADKGSIGHSGAARDAACGGVLSAGHLRQAAASTPDERDGEEDGPDARRHARPVLLTSRRASLGTASTSGLPVPVPVSVHAVLASLHEAFAGVAHTPSRAGSNTNTGEVARRAHGLSCEAHAGPGGDSTAPSLPQAAAIPREGDGDAPIRGSGLDPATAIASGDPSSRASEARTLARAGAGEQPVPHRRRARPSVLGRASTAK